MCQGFRRWVAEVRGKESLDAVLRGIIAASRRRWPVLVEDGHRMSVREPGPSSRANGAKFVVDHFLRGWRSMKKKKEN